jgi:mRNA-degrading endonuclease toxin of MazEF toxin-antitoxin module
VSAPDIGVVLSYWFLWRAEFEAGEESGRKARPSVVVLAVERGPRVTRIAVAPITHTPPHRDRFALELSPAVKAHLSLDAQRSWVICDELNEFNWPGFDLASKATSSLQIGRLPYGVMRQIRTLVAEAVRQRLLKITDRD